MVFCFVLLLFICLQPPPFLTRFQYCNPIYPGTHSQNRLALNFQIRLLELKACITTDLLTIYILLANYVAYFSNYCGKIPTICNLREKRFPLIYSLEYIFKARHCASRSKEHIVVGVYSDITCSRVS